MGPLDAVVFDLDGTLVHTEHDYAAWKRALGLPPGLAVLEGLATLPPAARAVAEARLDALEREHAARAAAIAGAEATLAALSGRVRLGILTRNTRATALTALAGAGLARFFDPADVLGRDEAAPKPAPDGVLLLLARWGAAPRRAAMVGDVRFDLEAGRAAGVWAIGFDPAATGALAPWADHVVTALPELVACLDPAQPRG